MNATAKHVGTSNSAQKVRSGNAAARQVARCTGGGDCPLCQRMGLPVLVTRYAVTPSFVIPGNGYKRYPGLLGDKVHDKGLQAHAYTLRTLRQGFVYVYFGSKGHWHVYAVTPNGYLRLLPDPDDVDAKKERDLSEQCERKGDGIPASFIHLPPAIVKKGGKVWIAFSTAQWTEAVRGNYEKAPDQRMQSFDIAGLAGTPGAQPHTFAPVEAFLHDNIGEYATDANELKKRLTYNARDAFTQKNSEYTWSYAAPLMASRIGKAPETAKYVADYEKLSGGKQKVSAVALLDAVGIVQELNATRLHFVESCASYAATYVRQNTVSQSILGLKKFNEQNALLSRELSEQAQNKADVQTEHIYIPDDLPSMAQTITVTTTRAERAADDAKSAWGRLEKNYDEDKRKNFQETYDKGFESFKKTIEQCDSDWSIWADDSQWKTWFDDFDPLPDAQHAALIEMCSPCLAGGIVESLVAEAAKDAPKRYSAGYNLWKKWLEAKPDAKDNPIYRALFGNRQEILTNLLPEDGDVKKGDKVYDTVRRLVQSDEFKNHVQGRLKQAIGATQLAIATASNHLGNQVSTAVQQVVFKAQAASYKLYHDMNVLVFTANLTVQQYVDLLAAQAFQKTQYVMNTTRKEAGQAVRSILAGGMNALRIVSPQARNTIMAVTFCVLLEGDMLAKSAAMKGDALKNWLRQQVGVAKEAQQALGAITTTIKLSAVTLGIRAEAALGELMRGVSFELREATNLIGGTLARGRAISAHGGEFGLAAGAAVFQWWVLIQSVRSYGDAIGSYRADADLAVMSAITGTVGATTESLGLGAKVLAQVGSKGAAEEMAAFGARWALRGGVIAAGASAFDSFFEFHAGRRSGRQGDNAARNYHYAASAAFGMAAVTGIAAAVTESTVIFSASSILGPFGWTLALVAVGVILAMAAVNAERSVAEIWLDRCYFGLHKRAEGAWTDAQFDDELAGLNAIALGLEASMGFNDDLWGTSEFFTNFDTVKMKVFIPPFEEESSACAIKLSLFHPSRGYIDAIYLRTPNLAALPSQDWKTIYGRESNKWFHQPVVDMGRPKGIFTVSGEVEVNTKYFQKARLSVDFWQDYALDPNAKAHFERDDED